MRRKQVGCGSVGGCGSWPLEGSAGWGRVEEEPPRAVRAPWQRRGIAAGSARVPHDHKRKRAGQSSLRVDRVARAERYAVVGRGDLPPTQPPHVKFKSPVPVHNVHSAHSAVFSVACDDVAGGIDSDRRSDRDVVGLDSGVPLWVSTKLLIHRRLVESECGFVPHCVRVLRRAGGEFHGQLTCRGGFR